MLAINSIEKIMHTDFQFVSDKLSDTELLDTLRHAQGEIFHLIDGRVFHIRYSADDHRGIEYERCDQVTKNDDMKDIMANLSDAVYILVLEKDTPVGYLTVSELSEFIYSTYHYLRVFIDTILDTTDESVTVVDDDKRVLAWTKGAENLFSVKQKDILGKPITDFFKDHNLELLNTLQGEAVHHKQHWARDDQVVLINSKPVYMNNNIIGAVVSETDITDQITLSNELYHTTEKLFSLEKEVNQLTANGDPFHPIRGSSPILQETINKVKKAAMTDANILIQGESGVGKELFAKAAHYVREGQDAPFVAVNCGAIPEALFESEFFGYEKGAFSGANQKGKKGKVELARYGTLFLDEIGEMPLDMQVKMLRLLQEKKFFPVGGTEEVEVDFRVIVATNKDLSSLVDENQFREDLFYRLNVVSIDIPPLRERPSDIIELSHYFLNKLSIKYKQPIQGITQPIMQALLQHNWPGNIRELENTIERLIVFSDDGEIKIDDLPFKVKTHWNRRDEKPGYSAENNHNGDLSLNERLLDAEREILKQELDKSQGNKLKCAKKLQITRATLYNRLKKVGLN